MLKVLRYFFPFVFFLLIAIYFYSDLFFPKPKLPATPDYGRSDLLHFNIPLRYKYAEKLKQGELYFWEDKIGQGFPIFAEGQLGQLYLPNLILYRFLPFWLAFNLSFVATFTIAGLGLYLLARSYRFARSASLLAGLFFAFAPPFMLQMHHLNLIQTTALFPYYFLLINLFFQSRKIFFLGLLPFLVSQQIFIGFPQITAYSLIGATLFFIYKIRQGPKSFTQSLKVASLYIAIISLGFLMAAPQLSSTYILYKNSSRNETPQSILTDFPFKFDNLKTIVNPYILGNIKDGTYPHWEKNKWGIFWENNIYIGLVPLILTAIFLIKTLFKKSKKQTPQDYTFWIFMSVLGIGLALGTQAPLHPLFSFPPLSMFRVPARFLIFTFLATSLISIFTLESLIKKNKKVIVFLLIVLALIDYSYNWKNYNLLIPKEKIFSTPETAITIGSNVRIFVPDALITWQSVFKEKGWKNQTEKYLFLKDFLDRNLNLIFDVESVQAYAGMAPKRLTVFESLLNSGFKQENGLEITTLSENLLDMANVTYIITSSKLNSIEWEFIRTEQLDEITVNVYKNKNILPKAYITKNYVQVKTLNETVKELGNLKASQNKDTIIEKDVRLDISGDECKNQPQITYSNSTKIEILTSNSNECLLVVSSSFYPGWEARIDNNETEILPANINSKAVKIGKGNQKIELSYKEKFFTESFLTGSFASLLFIGLVYILKKRATKN